MDTITKTMTLKPLRSGASTLGDRQRVYYEQILVCEGEYPVAMVHIDLFFVKDHHEDNTIYRRLDKGEAVECFVTFKISDAHAV
jgi:hypothetical protein